MQLRHPLPGGEARRVRAAGASAGAPLSRFEGALDAFSLVEDEMSRAEEALRELVHSDVAAVPVVAGHLAAAGGKRLRAALTALGARVVGATVSPKLMCCGELIHLGSLLHDDVVDDGDARRGRPAAHRVYGNAVAVLTGDFCLARAVLLAAEEGGLRAVTELGRAVTEMAEGEVLQLQREGDLSCGVEEYLEVVERKSAALIAWSAAAAAWSAGDDAAADALARFGRSVGIAFQITDDVLDYAEGTGKLPGRDLAQRKVTLPLLHAMDRMDGLRTRLERGDPTDAELPELIAAIRASGALDAALDDAHGYVETAIAALQVLPESTARSALQVLARYLVERTT